MELPNSISPIRNLGKSFAVNGDMVALDTFTALGKATKGRYHIVLFHRDTLDWRDLKVDVESEIAHSGSLTQYLIKSIEGVYIGSLLVVNPRLCLYAPYRVSIKDKDTATEFNCKGEGGTGGVLVYNDDSSNSVAIALSTKRNSFLVTVGNESRGDS